jgi:hypothetical protein
VQRKIILVIAPSGAGKTHLVSDMLVDLDRVAVFDMVKDTQYTNKTKTIVISGKPRIFAETIGAFLSKEEQEKQKFQVVYHPAITEVQDNGLIDSPEFNDIVHVCQERGHMYLVIDEAHFWCNSYNCPKELHLANLIGRHDELSLILISQRINGVHPAIRENADEFYFWKIVTPTGLKMVREYCGDDVADQVQALRAVELDKNDKFVTPGQYLHWSKFRGVEEVTE